MMVTLASTNPSLSTVLVAVVASALHAVIVLQAVVTVLVEYVEAGVTSELLTQLVQLAASLASQSISSE